MGPVADELANGMEGDAGVTESAKGVAHRYRLMLDIEANDVDDLVARLHDIGYDLATGKLSRSGVRAGGSGTCIHAFTEKED